VKPIEKPLLQPVCVRAHYDGEPFQKDSKLIAEDVRGFGEHR
jgi:hypothetical protein